MDNQLWDLVMIKYPKIPRELSCRTEKAFRDAARKSYYEKLLRQQQEQGTPDGDELAQHSATGSSE